MQLIITDGALTALCVSLVRDTKYKKIGMLPLKERDESTYILKSKKPFREMCSFICCELSI